jgi:hypothetical protein
MARHLSFRLGLLSIFVAAHLSMSVNALSQSADLALTRSEEADLDSLALHTAQKIRQAKLEEKEPHVLVIDFFRSSQGNSSRLGTLLADRFSESLSAYSAGLKVLDRNTLKDHLTKEWTTLEDLESNDICLRIGRQLGATGVILGTLYEENGQISLTIHLEGFGPVANKTDAFEVMDERVRFPRVKRCTPRYSNPVPSIPAQPMTSRRSQAYSGPVSRASHPLFAFIVHNQITQTRLGSPNFKEPCACLSLSPPKEKPHLYLSRKERPLA